jgi:hypothetical protein
MFAYLYTIKKQGPPKRPRALGRNLRGSLFIAIIFNISFNYVKKNNIGVEQTPRKLPPKQKTLAALLTPGVQ